MRHNQSIFEHCITYTCAATVTALLSSPRSSSSCSRSFNQFIALLCILGFTLWNSITHKNTLDIVCQK